MNWVLLSALGALPHKKNGLCRQFKICPLDVPSDGHAIFCLGWEGACLVSWPTVRLSK